MESETWQNGRVNSRFQFNSTLQKGMANCYSRKQNKNNEQPNLLFAFNRFQLIDSIFRHKTHIIVKQLTEIECQ